MIPALCRSVPITRTAGSGMKSSISFSVCSLLSNFCVSVLWRSAVYTLWHERLRKRGVSRSEHAHKTWFPNPMRMFRTENSYLWSYWFSNLKSLLKKHNNQEHGTQRSNRSNGIWRFQKWGFFTGISILVLFCWSNHTIWDKEVRVNFLEGF